MSDRSSLAICRDDGFIIKDTVPDISLCAQDLFASGVLLLCSILCCVAYTMHHIFNAASSRRRQVVSTREDAAERLLTREDSPDVKGEGDEPGALEVPVIEIDPNALSADVAAEGLLVKVQSTLDAPPPAVAVA